MKLSESKLVENCFNVVLEVFDSSDNIRFYDTVVDSTNNIILVGSLDDNSFITKLDSDKSNILWKKKFNNKDGRFYGISVDSSNDIVMVGETNNNSVYYYGHIVKLNPDGNILWQKRFSTSKDSHLDYVAIDQNNNIIVTGSIICKESIYNAYIAKLDSKGNILWIKKFDTGDNSCRFYSISVDSNDNVIIVGEIDNGFNCDAYIVKINSETGDILWQRQFNYKDDVRFYSVAIDCEDNIIVVGELYENCEWHAIMIKLDVNGNILWKKKFTDKCSNSFRGVVIDSNSDILAVGFSNTETVCNAYITKLNPDGNVLWQKLFRCNSNNTFSEVTINSNDDIIAIGAINNSFNWSSFILKLTSNIPTNIVFNDTCMLTNANFLISDIEFSIDVPSITVSDLSLLVLPTDIACLDAVISIKKYSC